MYVSVITTYKFDLFILQFFQFKVAVFTIFEINNTTQRKNNYYVTLF